VINKAGIERGQSRWSVVVDCRRISATDFTAAKGFKVSPSAPRRLIEKHLADTTFGRKTAGLLPERAQVGQEAGLINT
jgi:hypothetical protein